MHLSTVSCRASNRLVTSTPAAAFWTQPKPLRETCVATSASARDATSSASTSAPNSPSQAKPKSPSQAKVIPELFGHYGSDKGSSRAAGPHRPPHNNGEGRTSSGTREANKFPPARANKSAPNQARKGPSQKHSKPGHASHAPATPNHASSGEVQAGHPHTPDRASLQHHSSHPQPPQPPVPVPPQNHHLHPQTSMDQGGDNIPLSTLLSAFGRGHWICSAPPGTQRIMSYLRLSKQQILLEREQHGWSTARKVSVVVLLPNVELATKVHACAFSELRCSEGESFHVQLVTGGSNIRNNIMDLRHFCPDVLVATPGRLQHLLQQTLGKLDHLLGDVQLVVMDEAETMVGTTLLRLPVEDCMRKLDPPKCVLYCSDVGGSTNGQYMQLALWAAAALPKSSLKSDSLASPLISEADSLADLLISEADSLAPPLISPPPLLTSNDGHNEQQQFQQEQHLQQPQQQQQQQENDGQLQCLPQQQQQQWQHSHDLQQQQQQQQNKLRLRQQFVVVSADELPIQLYASLLSHAKTTPDFKVVVYCATSALAMFYAEACNRLGLPSLELHSRKSTEYRQQALDMFNMGKSLLLFTTADLPYALELQGMTKIVQVGLPINLHQHVRQLSIAFTSSSATNSATFPAPPAPAAPLNSTTGFSSASSAGHVPHVLQSLDSMADASSQLVPSSGSTMSSTSSTISTSRPSLQQSPSGLPPPPSHLMLLMDFEHKIMPLVLQSPSGPRASCFTPPSRDPSPYNSSIPSNSNTGSYSRSPYEPHQQQHQHQQTPLQHQQHQQQQHHQPPRLPLEQLQPASQHSISMLAMRTQSALSKISEAKRKAAYISFIGHQRANFKGVLPPAPLVSQANLLALGMALPGPPALPTDLVARLGLQNVAGVCMEASFATPHAAFVQSGLGQETGSQGGHGGMRRETGKARAGGRTSQAKGNANVRAGAQVEWKKGKKAGSGKDQLARKWKKEEGSL